MALERMAVMFSSVKTLILHVTSLFHRLLMRSRVIGYNKSSIIPAILITTFNLLLRTLATRARPAAFMFNLKIQWRQDLTCLSNFRSHIPRLLKTFGRVDAISARRTFTAHCWRIRPRVCYLSFIVFIVILRSARV